MRRELDFDALQRVELLDDRLERRVVFEFRELKQDRVLDGHAGGVDLARFVAVRGSNRAATCWLHCCHLTSTTKWGCLGIRACGVGQRRASAKRRGFSCLCEIHVDPWPAKPESLLVSYIPLATAYFFIEQKKEAARCRRKPDCHQTSSTYIASMLRHAALRLRPVGARPSSLLLLPRCAASSAARQGSLRRIATARPRPLTLPQSRARETAATRVPRRRRAAALVNAAAGGGGEGPGLGERAGASVRVQPYRRGRGALRHVRGRRPRGVHG